MATICSYCAAANRPEARFCHSCGRALSGSGPPVCVACNAQLRPGASFCHRCGQRAAAQPANGHPPPGPAVGQGLAAEPLLAVVCPTCGQSNRPEARFCRRCRASLRVACANCGHENHVTAKFCHECGEPVHAAPPEAGPGRDQSAPPSPPGPGACEFCQRPMPAGVRFCPHCGKSPAVRLPALSDRFATGQIPRGEKLKGSQGAEYLVLRLIAKGGMGAVYEVGHLAEGTRWAMKEMSELPFSHGDRAAVVAKFQEEADLLRVLRHEHLPRVVDVFEFNHRHYLVMELIEGQTLGKRLEDAGGPLPEREVVEWGAQLCRVLAFLHSRNPPIIYRDLKPDNIMVDAASGQIKLIDFGIARRFKGGKRSDTLMLGTRGYAAPEQFGQGESDARTDLFALGATLHHLLTNENPTNRRLFQFPPLDGYAGLKLSPRTCQAIAAATQIAPEDRPADAATFYKALSGQTVPAPPAATLPPGGAPVAAPRPALTGRLGPAVPLDLGTAERGRDASGTLPVAVESPTLPVEPLADWLEATPDVLTPGSPRVTVLARTGRLALGREDRPVSYQPRFIVDGLWWLILWLYSRHARFLVPAPRQHVGTVRVGQQNIAVAVVVTPTPGALSAGRLVSAAAVALELAAGLLAFMYLALLV